MSLAVDRPRSLSTVLLRDELPIVLLNDARLLFAEALLNRHSVIGAPIFREGSFRVSRLMNLLSGFRPHTTHGC